MSSTLKKLYKQYSPAVIRPLVTIAIALVIGFFIIIPTGVSPFEAYGIMFKGAYGSVTGWLGTLAKATPLIFTGLAAAFASNGGCFNIGIEGQLYMGGFAAAIVGFYGNGLPGFILLPLCLIAAMLAAALWALLPGILNNKLQINIFIMFFITNNMAMLLTEYFAAGPFRGELAGVEATGKIASQARLVRFSRYADVNVGIIIAVVIALILWFIMYKTRFGYECSALGNNATFSEFIGIKHKRQSMVILMISAMIAGLGGAEQTMGVLGRFYPSFSNDYGFTGISIGMLASNNPIGVIIFAIFFGGLAYGGQQLEANTIISTDLVGVIQAIIIMLISADFISKKVKASKKKSKENLSSQEAV